MFMLSVFIPEHVSAVLRIHLVLDKMMMHLELTWRL